MKIALITNFCTHYRYKLFTKLVEEYNFDIYFYDDVNRTKEDIKHLTIYNKKNKFNHLTTFKILKTIFQKKYDIIINSTNNKWLFIGSLIISKLKKTKIILWCTIWSYPKNIQYKIFAPIFEIILKKYIDAILVYGIHGKKFLIEKGINPKKIFIATQAVDNELYGRNIRIEEKIEAMKKFNIAREKKVILYVGRLIKLKGIEYLLETLVILKSWNLDFFMLFCGDGNLKREIEIFCKTNNISHSITGIIKFHEMPLFYSISYLLVLPSISLNGFKEPWGLVINEAFNQGCPAVVTDIVGAAAGKLVIDGYNGFIVQEKNSLELAKAISKLLIDDKLRNNFSENAKSEIKKFTYEKQINAFLEAIKYTLSKK